MDPLFHNFLGSNLADERDLSHLSSNLLPECRDPIYRVRSSPYDLVSCS